MITLLYIVASLACLSISALAIEKFISTVSRKQKRRQDDKESQRELLEDINYKMSLLIVANKAALSAWDLQLKARGIEFDIPDEITNFAGFRE